jgi:hypothetical protein
VKVRQSHRFTFHPPPPRIHPSCAFTPSPPAPKHFPPPLPPPTTSPVPFSRTVALPSGFPHGVPSHHRAPRRRLHLPLLTSPPSLPRSSPAPSATTPFPAPPPSILHLPAARCPTPFRIDLAGAVQDRSRRATSSPPQNRSRAVTPVVYLRRPGSISPAPSRIDLAGAVQDRSRRRRGGCQNNHGDCCSRSSRSSLLPPLALAPCRHSHCPLPALIYPNTTSLPLRLQLGHLLQMVCYPYCSCCSWVLDGSFTSLLWWSFFILSGGVSSISGYYMTIAGAGASVML